MLGLSQILSILFAKYSERINVIILYLIKVKSNDYINLILCLIESISFLWHRSIYPFVDDDFRRSDYNKPYNNCFIIYLLLFSIYFGLIKLVHSYTKNLKQFFCWFHKKCLLWIGCYEIDLLCSYVNDMIVFNEFQMDYDPNEINEKEMKCLITFSLSILRCCAIFFAIQNYYLYLDDLHQFVRSKRKRLKQNRTFGWLSQTIIDYLLLRYLVTQVSNRINRNDYNNQSELYFWIDFGSLLGLALSYLRYFRNKITFLSSMI
ncbi:protein phosphatase 6 [Sarcoptes scabiei]|nr:protein phosphatase 6 [Sarcoptes scabiei]